MAQTSVRQENRIAPTTIHLLCHTVALSLLIRPCMAAAKETAVRPLNVVVIMADDLGWMGLHCQGNELFDTPNIDRLARQGMRFTDAYAAAPVCTPTRAAMMTGQSPARLAITNHAPGHPTFVPEGADLRGAEWTTSLALEYVTIAERLKAAGYATGFVGKWHLSHRPRGAESGPAEPDLRPEHQGFDLNIGGCDRGGPPSYFEPYRILRQSGPLQRSAITIHYPNYAFHGRNRLGGMIRQGDFKLIEFYDDHSVELYNLADDIGERHDLSKDRPELTDRMRRDLNAWLQATHARMPIRIARE